MLRRWSSASLVPGTCLTTWLETATNHRQIRPDPKTAWTSSFVPLDRPANVAPASKDHPDHLEALVAMVSQVLMDSQAAREMMGQTPRKAIQSAQFQNNARAQAAPDHLELLDLKDQPDQLVQLAQMPVEVMQVQPVLQGPTAKMVRQARLEPRENKAQTDLSLQAEHCLRDHLVQQVTMGQLVLQVKQEEPELVAQMANRESLDQQDQQVAQEAQDMTVHPVRTEPLVATDLATTAHRPDWPQDTKPVFGQLRSGCPTEVKLKEDNVSDIWLSCSPILTIFLFLQGSF